MCMSRPVDRMTLDELKKLREDWTYELHEKQGAYNLLSLEISFLEFIDVATMDDWNAAAQGLMDESVRQRRSIFLLEKVIDGVTGRIRQLEPAS